MDSGQSFRRVELECLDCGHSSPSLIPQHMLIIWDCEIQIGHPRHLLSEKFLDLSENWFDCFYCNERMPHKWDTLKDDIMKHLICLGCGKRQLIENHEDSPDGTLQVAEVNYE